MGNSKSSGGHSADKGVTKDMPAELVKEANAKDLRAGQSQSGSCDHGVASSANGRVKSMPVELVEEAKDVRADQSQSESCDQETLLSPSHM